MTQVDRLCLGWLEVEDAGSIFTEGSSERFTDGEGMGVVVA